MPFGSPNSVSRVSQFIRLLPVCCLFYFLSVPCALRAQFGPADNGPSQAERDAQTQLQLTTDAQRVATYKAALTLLPESARRGEISQQQLPRDLQYAQTVVTGAQQKYDALGGDWGRRFTQALDEDSQKLINDAHLTLRLKDQQTPLGVDAHAAATCIENIDRNAIFREQGAATAAAEQQADAGFKFRLNQLNAKYARSSEGADYRDRVTRLVEQVEATGKEQWVLQAQQYRAQHPDNGPLSLLSNLFAPVANFVTSLLGPTTSTSQTRSTSPVSVALLVLLLLGGAAYYFFQRSSQQPATASYSDLKSLSTASPTAESPAARTPAATPPAPKTSTPPPPGTVKERLFAEQRQKYQARYNDVMDQVTAATAELGRLGNVVSGIQANLKLLGKNLQSRVRAMAVSQYSSFANLARSAALGKPLLRVFKRAGGLLKIVIFIGVAWFALVAATLAYHQDWVDLALSLASIFVTFFFLERYLQLKIPLAVLKRGGDKLKQLSLAYVYDDQVLLAKTGAPGYRVMRVLSESKGSPIEEFPLSANSWGTTIRPASCLLYVESMAVYRVDPNGTFAPLFANNASEIVQNYGRWITEALNEQKSFAAATLAPLAAYAQVALRRKRASEELPGLEKLVQTVDRVESAWRDVYVSDKVIDLLLHRIDMFNMRYKATPPGILLYGYAGNGKAYLAKKIAESISARLEAVPATLNSRKDVKEIWDRCRGKEPVVLFVDYAERVFPKFNSKNAGAGTRETTLAWMGEWAKMDPQQSRVWVVMSAESEQDLYEEVVAKFGSSKIEITSPDNAGREMIFRAACTEFQVPGALPAWLIGDTGGSSINDLREIVQGVKMYSSFDVPDDEQWRKAVDAVRTVFPRDPTKTWEHLILPADIKGELQAACRILRDANSYRAVGAEVPNILLYGPPGTGKTEIARTIANEGGVQFVLAGTADLKAGYIGQSAGLVRSLFAKARAAAPAVLFIDEIESVVPKRDNAGTDSFSKDIVTEMNEQINGAQNYDRPVFLLAATNFKDQIDDAILNRFTTTIEVPLPDLDARADIFKGLIRNLKAADPALNVDEVAALMAQRTDGQSGRSLGAIVKSAMSKAVLKSTSPADVRLTRELLVAEVMPKGHVVSEADLQKIWSQIVLKPEIKDSIINKIHMFTSGDPAAPSGLLLYGPSGTGKTEIARRIADSTGGDFIQCKGSDLKGMYAGEGVKNVRKIWDGARARGRAVIFVDECDAIFSRRGSVDTDRAIEEIVPEFLQSWDGMDNKKGQVWVVGATNLYERIDSAIIRRFGATVEIGLPETPQRMEILRLEMKKMGRDAEVPEFAGAATQGLSGGILKEIAKAVCSEAAGQKSAPTPEIWKKVIPEFTKGGSTPVAVDAIWETLALPDELIEQLKFTAESLRQVELVKKQGYKPARGMLFYGPPGTGKTQIARTLANESGLPFLFANPADLKAGYLGQAGQKVREIFQRAREKSPCILFIDELDITAAQRGGPTANTLTDEMVGTMLTELDGVKEDDRTVFLLAATNHREMVDSAVLERFLDQIEIPYPDAQMRVRILEIMLSKKTSDFDQKSVAADVATIMGNVSGRELYNLIERAGQKAMARALKEHHADKIILTRDDVYAAIPPDKRAKTTTPTISEVDLQKIWSRIVLKPEIKDSIMTKIRMFSSGDPAAPSGLLLYGPSGTGKTEIARRIADSTGGDFIPCKGSDLKGMYAGEGVKNVRKVWDNARARGRAVIFVDECDAIFGRRGSVDTDKAIEELVPEFLQSWDGMDNKKGQVWVVGATNLLDRIDSAIIRRFGATVEIGLPEAPQRMEILRLEMKKMGRDAEVPEFVGAVTTGLSGGILKEIVKAVCTEAATQNSALTPEIWQKVIPEFVKQGGTEVEGGATWDTLALPGDLIEQLQLTSESLRHIEVLKKQGFKPSRGMLLYGPPGTGKTQIARTLANESGLAFLAANPADLKAGFLGQAGQKVRETFQRAREKSPCILFIDELDITAAQRGGPTANSLTDEMVGTMLTELDGVKANNQTIFLLAATNHREMVDNGILERFRDQIEIPYPDVYMRARIVEILLAKKPLDFDPKLVAPEIATIMGHVSGRELSNLVERASEKAIGRALKEHRADRVILTRDDLYAAIPADKRAAIPPPVNRGQSDTVPA